MQSQQFTEHFQTPSPNSDDKFKRCPNANDEVCKYPNCKCLAFFESNSNTESTKTTSE